MPDLDESATRTFGAATRACSENPRCGGRKRTGTTIADASGAWDAAGRLIPNGDASGEGGHEVDFLTQMQVIEAPSIADASAGWCTMIGIDGGDMTAYIDQSVAREMYSDIDLVMAATFASPGKAVKTGTASSLSADGGRGLFPSRPFEQAGASASCQPQIRRR
jgi:hypothetical protein